MGFCLWLTGLPGSGKSTILVELSRMLGASGIKAVVLSLDHIRKLLTPEPKYTEEERALVYRSLVLMGLLLVEEGGKNVIIDATGNRREFRELARRLIPEFAEIYVKCPLDTCREREASRRDRPVQKDLYKSAAEGKLKGGLPGISAPYEEPQDPEVLVRSDILSPHESAKAIMAYLGSRWLGQVPDAGREGGIRMLNRDDVKVPLDVPPGARSTYTENYLNITKGSGRLMLFAGDQKAEHLNDDFCGEGIHPDDCNPEHLFRIASRAKIGVFAAQLGLISRYGMDYPHVPYLVKLNSKTNLVKTSQSDPFSSQWFDVQDVIHFRADSGLNIPAIGYTLYPGSKYEAEMLRQAAKLVYDAHKHGLVTVLWVYPRGKAVTDEKDPHLIAGATGLAACLGSDFVKVNYPKKEGYESKELFKEAVAAAGRTKVVCAGGSSVNVEAFLQQMHDQIFVSGASGNATGRNIHQKSLEVAIRMCNAIYAITVNGESVEDALKVYHSSV